jgi:hypothetical protein
MDLRNIDTTQISATGTPSGTTYLRGDNTWQTISAGTDFYTTSGTLTSARTVTMAGNALTFTGGQTTCNGAGTTSATKGLSVQNSAGTKALECFDNTKTFIYQSGNTIPAIVVANVTNTESQSLRIFSYNNGGNYSSALISWTELLLQSEVAGVTIKGGNSGGSFNQSCDIYGGTTNLAFRVDNQGRSIFTSAVNFYNNMSLQANDKVIVDGFNFAIKNSSSVPSTNIVDFCRLYASDQVAGNSCFHTRTENGAIVKLYQETTAVTSGTLVSNAGTTLTSTDTIDGYTLQQVVKALRNLGILA